jgi:thiol-disulfide isomerase/thioredoxin
MYQSITLFFLLFMPMLAVLPAQTAPPVYESFDDLAPVFEFQNDTTYVINFWATWCKPCVEELPYLEQIHEVYAGQAVKVILVSLDFPSQVESKLIPFMEEWKLQSDVVVLTDGKYNDWIGRVSEEWDGAIPVTLIYRNSDRRFISGAVHSFTELKSVIDALLP